MILLEFTRDMLPSEGGYRKGQRPVLDPRLPEVQRFIREGAAIVCLDARFPDGAFYGLPPAIPEPRKRYMTRKG